MLFKQISQDIKDIDEGKGIIVAYANVYNNEDSDGDISAFGSFTKTVSENAKRLRVLKDHNSTISLGVPLNVDAADPYGLKTTTQFNLKKEVARDMYEDIKLYKANGLNAELSIGYNVMKRDSQNKSIISEYRLMEYSFLTSWAANEMAIVQDVKSMDNTKLIELITKMYDLNYSDTRLVAVENILKSLETIEPLVASTNEVEPINEQLIKFLSLIKK